MNVSILLRAAARFTSGLYIWLALLILASAQIEAQPRNVTFVHGLGEVPSVWNEFIADIEDRYDVNTFAPSWQDGRLSSRASTLFVPTNSVVIGHSAGGILAREKYRASADGRSRVADLITIGTPHAGAPIGKLAELNGVAMAGYWTADLTVPWALLIGCSSWLCDLAQAAVGSGLPMLAEHLFEKVLNENDALQGETAEDLAPGSAFLGTLNASPSATYPASGSYFIYGDEDFQTPLRIADSGRLDFLGQSPVEQGELVEWFDYASFVYFINSVIAWWAEQNALDNYAATWDWAYLEAAAYWGAVSDSFYSGYGMMAAGWQYEYSEFIVGNTLYYDLNGGDFAGDDDGFIPNGSQAPSFLAQGRRLRADGVNHLEETAAPAAFAQIEFAMEQDDIDVPEAGSSAPLASSITGPSSVSNGQTSTWRASASGGQAPYSYGWRYRENCRGTDLESDLRESCSSTWRNGGSASTFSRQFYGPHTHTIQLRTTDASGTAKVSTRTVTVN